MELSQFPITLTPQAFDDDSALKTVLPERDFFKEFKEMLPSVYQKAPNFLEVVKVIADSYQELYDIIRSLANVPNVAGDPDTTTGMAKDIYALMFARMIGVNIVYTQTASGTLLVDEGVLYDTIVQKLIAMNSRGTHRYYENYYISKNLYSYFNNTNIQELASRTVVLKTPFANDAASKAAFEADIAKIKAGGIRINESQAVATSKFFWFSSNPNSGGAIIDFESDTTTNRGNFGSLVGGIPQGSGRFSDILRT